MDKIILQKISDSPSELCFVAPYSGILQSLDIKVNDTFLYCYCGGLDFRYGYIHDHKWSNKYICDRDTVSIEGSNDIKNAIREQFGICFKEILFEDTEQAINRIMNELSVGKNVICFADAFFLPYHPQYHKNHGQTILTILDYDSEKKDLVILDRHVTTIPVSRYFGPIFIADFEKALICGENVFDGKKTGIITYDDSCGERLFALDIEKQLINMAYRMLSDNDVLTGISGINTFGNDVLKWKGQWDDSQLKWAFNCAYKHIMGRGGPYISRKAYAEFMLRQYNESNIGNLFSTVSRKWHSLSVKFFRNTLDINKNSLENISGLIHGIANEEAEIYNLIINMFR